jgi:hypothetical protein
MMLRLRNRVSLLFALILAGCIQAPSATSERVATDIATTKPTVTPAGEILTVENPLDSGPGSLRQALLDAKPGDTIRFDPQVFPLEHPATIKLVSCFASLDQGGLTIDASDAGVLIDGSGKGENFCAGLEIHSDGNIVRGLRFDGFAPGIGIALAGGAKDNLIGGDPHAGPGPLGQGNLVGHGDLGIGAWDAGTSGNTIAGNFVGIGPDGADIGNSGSGIWISEGAGDNVIGPDNHIALNDTYGVESSGSSGNAITRNSIHDNARGEIHFVPARNLQLVHAPVLMDFDLAAGDVSGAACPSCAVEVFSDDANGGEIFEGRVTADGNGTFSLKDGHALTGPHLTATTTDGAGTTSQFSSPTQGTSQRIVLQEGNTLPRTILPSFTSVELADNHMSEQFTVHCQSGDPGEAASYFDNLNELGLTWARLSVDWFDWPEVDLTGDFSRYEVGDCERQAIEMLHANGIRIVYTLVYWDTEIKLAPGYSRFRNQHEIDRFLDYVRFTVGEFKDDVEWWSLLNEPNAEGYDQRHVLVDDYINLVRQAIPVIREADPEGRIIVGNVTPLNESGSYAYLKRIVETDDVVSAADGIAWHGSSGLSLEYQPDFYKNYPAWVEDIRETAWAHGFDGQFIADELHWRTPATPQTIGGNPWYYTDSVAAKYYARGIVSHLGQGIRVGIGHESWEAIPQVMNVDHGLANLMSGASPADLSVTIEGNAEQVQRYSFLVLPGGDRLLAVWRDGKAVDEDPGVPVSVIISGVSAKRIVAFDVFHSIQQPLVTVTSGDSLVIRNFLIKDYPIILMFTDT